MTPSAGQHRHRRRPGRPRTGRALGRASPGHCGPGHCHWRQPAGDSEAPATRSSLRGVPVPAGRLGRQRCRRPLPGDPGGALSPGGRAPRLQKAGELRLPTSGTSTTPRCLGAAVAPLLSRRGSRRTPGRCRIGTRSPTGSAAGGSESRRMMHTHSCGSMPAEAIFGTKGLRTKMGDSEHHGIRQSPRRSLCRLRAASDVAALLAALDSSPDNPSTLRPFGVSSSPSPAPR
jgi:hypothetical protein